MTCSLYTAGLRRVTSGLADLMQALNGATSTAGKVQLASLVLTDGG